MQQAYIIRVIDGVEQKNIYLNLTDYPNPTSDNLWLRLDEYFYQPISYLIIENSGKLISKAEISESEIEIKINHLASGSYYIIVRQGQ